MSNVLNESGQFALIHAVEYPVLKIIGPAFIDSLVLTSSDSCMPSIGIKNPSVQTNYVPIDNGFGS